MRDGSMVGSSKIRITRQMPFLTQETVVSNFLKAKEYGVVAKRERVFYIGFSKDLNGKGQVA